MLALSLIDDVVLIVADGVSLIEPEEDLLMLGELETLPDALSLIVAEEDLLIL